MYKIDLLRTKKELDMIFFVYRYTPGSPIVSYDNGNQVRKATGVASTATFNWGSVAQTTGRDYGIHAVLTPGNYDCCKV